MRALLIFNPAAGRGEADRARIEGELRRSFDLTVALTTKDCDADACARAALAHADPSRRPELVVAAGGDGTVSLVAGVLAGTNVPLGIVSLGTSNSIASGLGIPGDVPGALATLLGGEPRPIDTARANGRMMVLHASVGLHAATVGGTRRDAKNRWGILAYLKEGLAELTDLTEFKVEIETESEIIRCRAVNVTVANVAPLKTVFAHGPAEVVPDDGELDVTIVAASSLVEVVATFSHLFRSAQRGEAATRDNVGYLSARRLRIDADPPQPLLVDGEAAGEGSLVITCVKTNLYVMVPREEKTDEAEPLKSERLEGLPELQIEPKPEPISRARRT